MRGVILIFAGLLLAGCAHQAASEAKVEIHVAAAANLMAALPDLIAAFERESGIHAVPSYGATAQLAQQIESGAPWDVFLAADVSHVDQLVKDGFAIPESRAIYARGRLVVWAPKRPDIRTMDDLLKARNISIAKPELAPYGAASVEALTRAGLWSRLKKEVVYAPSISVAKQYADTGNADAAFTALALTIGHGGNSFMVDAKLYQPIDQALCIVKDSSERKRAEAFTAFAKGAEARGILERFGYGLP